MVRDLERKTADWAVVFEYEILRGLGEDVVSDFKGQAFGWLRRLAQEWGRHLAAVLGHIMKYGELYEAMGNISTAIIKELPAELVGLLARQALSPSYLRAQARIRYAGALFDGDQSGLQEAQGVLEAPDAKLQQEIDAFLSGIVDRQR